MLLLLSSCEYKYFRWKRISVNVQSIELKTTHEENTRSDSFVGAHEELDEHYGSKHQQDNHRLHVAQLDALKTSK